MKILLPVVLLSTVLVLCSSMSHRGRQGRDDLDPMRRHHRHHHRRHRDGMGPRDGMSLRGGMGPRDMMGPRMMGPGIIGPGMMEPHHIQQSVDRTLAGLKKMTDDAIDKWPRLQRERNEREEHHGRRMRGRHMHDRERNDDADEKKSRVEVPKAAGAGLHFNLFNQLFDGLKVMMDPLKELDFGPLGFDWMLAREEPWYKGENVCKHREEKTEDLTGEIERHQVTASTVCDELESAYKCTAIMNVYGEKTTVIVTYTCCYGYERVEGMAGCPKELELRGLVDTAKGLGLTQFLKAVGSVSERLENTLTRDNFTIFAPVDEAFESIQAASDTMSNAVVIVSPDVRDEVSQVREVLQSHLLPGFVLTSRMEDEQVFESVYPRSTIRINHYNAPSKLTTANCVRVTSADHLATNGVIHVTERILPVVTESIFDIIARSPQHTMLASFVKKAGLEGTLRGPGQFTIFAPTDNAFRQLQEDTKMDYLLQANTCLKKGLQSHVLPNVICSSIIQSRGRTLNVLGDYLELNRTDDKVYVEGGSHVTEADVMATNGVIHIIDKVIVKKQVLNMLDAAREEGAREALALIRHAGLTKTLQELDEFTIFLPTNEAIQSLPRDTFDALMEDKELLKKVLMYHVVPKELRSRELYNDLEMDTLHEKKLTVKEYSSYPFSLRRVKTIQCVPLKHKEIESCNAITYMMDKVLLPPVGDLTDVLGTHSRFSRLVSLIKEAGLADTLQLGPYTVFAPTNEAFDYVDPVLLRDLARDPEKLKGFLSHHITHDTLCCAGMSLQFSLPWWRSMEITLDPGSNVVFTQQHNRQDDTTQIFVDKTPITNCDLTAANGVVHAIPNFLPSAAKKYGLSLIVSRARGRVDREPLPAPVKYQL